MIVMKFGGSSLESAHAIRRVCEIVKSRQERRPVVVVSAMGKTTNRLLALARAAVSGDADYVCQLAELRRYHWEEGLQLVGSGQLETLGSLLETHFAELGQLLQGLAILGELTPRSIDTVSSYGERLSSCIVSLAIQEIGLPALHIDARKVIVTDDRHTQANPIFGETNKRLKKVVGKATKKHIPVLGGFIGSTLTEITTTLGRGGGDYSAAIVGAGILAEEIQIWTDVDGMLTSDPRVVDNVRRVRRMSFSEAAELAYFGAKVLHPATVRPAIEFNIPVMILNSRNPDSSGTTIQLEAVNCDNVVKAIACKRPITLVTIHSARMLMTHGFLHKVFEVFDRFETPVDVVSTSEVSVSLTIDNPVQLEHISKALKEVAEIHVERDQAIVSVVGEGLRNTPGVAARVFKALQGVNVKMISQGASLLNLSVVIDDSQLKGAVTALHEEFFTEIDPDVFE